ncbi:hypothetical protein [Neotabrizicola sp. VNH66]|uniref:hypothetical protein n=1 Tax=Neotabrizicola sp. VNH66 TaxID=3400918 RepID=UPI003C10E9FC
MFAKLLRFQLAIAEVFFLGYALSLFKDRAPAAVAALTGGLVVVGLFTLLTGRGFPHFKSRPKASAIICVAGFFFVTAANIAAERREAELAMMRQTDPDAYLAAIKRDDDRWMAELEALRPEVFAAEAAQRAEKAKAARLAGCEGKESMAYIMIQTDVRNGLRAPSTAKFPSRFDKGTGYLGDCVYAVWGHFDAQNGFGAMIRGTFTGTITHLPESGQWRTLTLDIQG